MNRTFTASVVDACSVTHRIRITDSHVASVCWFEVPRGRGAGAPGEVVPVLGEFGFRG
ncbi:hypothetical protein [Cryobacterium sp. Y29]|uniref:hypothetical protein n=1 Tax=Cryobacterium sp. Y29 TaxID=2048285 RepID=UPI001304D90A|nr:hypothetical protein [Cryobacterium sp. Y29]